MSENKRWCPRCRKFHTGPAFDEQKALARAAEKIRDEIERQVMESLKNEQRINPNNPTVY